MPHFDPSISFGNVITAVTFLVFALLSWRDLNWRIKNLEVWRAANEHSTVQAVANVTMLREAIVKIEALAAGQDRRLILLEDRARFSHEERRLT